jgi:hypothetical protein
VNAPLSIPAESNPRRKLWTILALLILALVIAVERLHTWDEPLERDLTTYAVIGQGLLDGRPLYTGLWDNKPPAIHVTYELAVWIAGMGPAAVYFLTVFGALAVMLGAYCAGKSLDGRAETGLWAAGFWTIISGDLALQANQPNAELFMNACQTWALALWLRERGGILRLRAALIIGALMALSSLYKQTGLAVLGTAGAAYVLIQPSWCTRTKAAERVGLMFLVCAAAWAIIFGYFAVVGRLHDFVGAVFTFNRFLAEYTDAGSIFGNVRKGFTPEWLAPSFLCAAVWPLTVMTVLGLVTMWKIGWKTSALLVAVGLGTVLEVSAPGHFFPHYYQFWMPPLCIGAAWGVAGIRGLNTGWAKPAAVSLAALTVLLLEWHEAPYYRLTAEEWSRAKYGDEFIQTVRIGKDLSQRLKPGETFFAWCDEPGLYFYSGRLPPTLMLDIHPIIRGPLAPELSRRVLQQLDRAPPKVLIIAPQKYSRKILTFHPVLQWFQTRYRRVPDNGVWKGYVICVRPSGRADAGVQPGEVVGE